MLMYGTKLLQFLLLMRILVLLEFLVLLLLLQNVRFTLIPTIVVPVGLLCTCAALLLCVLSINMLELFVAFLQAFVFTLLTAVFIGLMRAEH